MIAVAPGAPFEAVTDAFPGELDGILGVRIRDGAGGEFLARTTAGIVPDVAVGSAALYRRTFEAAPTEAGQYWIVWDDAADAIDTEELRVTSSQADVGLPNGRDLCAIADVLGYVPGYDSDPETDAQLQALITAQSRQIYLDTAREFVAIPDLDPRLFEICRTDILNRRVRIGAAAQVDTVRLLAEDGVSLVADLDGLYATEPRIRQEWQPIDEIKLLRSAPTPALGQLLEVSGTWGYPSIPEDIRQACAKLVIVRYLTDVTFRGTAFSDALGESDVNIGGLLVSAREAIDNHAMPEVA